MSDDPCGADEGEPSDGGNGEEVDVDDGRIGFVVDALEQAESHLGDRERERAERLRGVSDSLQALSGKERAPDERRIHAHRTTLKELHGEVKNEDARVHLQEGLGRLSDLYESSRRY